ncbi:ImmA/IrrE family metallo-endopeptidase [Caenispirillum salinarum]|uniref:ImmA/IrrE family metallo-endopeptidase n=1 Tax=Caenispirillum salinarum TaxID=859058 RepID=UPI0006918355|nr:ImmA/IrrE family metallo-endopeptidase [Caenispirillum salinarum]
MTNRADMTTGQIISRHQGAAPVDLEGMARDLGIAVHYDRELPDTISGKIQRIGPGGSGSNFAIHINAKHHPNRQRFTLAHELAHFHMHRDRIREGVVDNEMYRSETLSNHLERQANQYAAAILLPAPLVKAEYQNTGGDVDEMARIFRVSPQAMQIRLDELKRFARTRAARGLSSLRHRHRA